MNLVLKNFVFCAVVSAFLSAVASDGEVLWWTIGNDYQSLEAKSEDGKVVATAGELGVTDVRIRYESEGGQSGYLTFFELHDDNTVSVHDGSAGFGAESGIGLPANYFGDLSALSGSPASYSFVIELGNYLDGSWARTSMVSEKVSYGDLVAKNHITAWEHDYPSYGQAWSPSSYTVVPEPSGGILLLIGGALLALRRKREA